MTTGAQPNFLPRRAVLGGALAIGAGAVVLPLAASGRARAADGPTVLDTSTWGARAASSPINVLTTPPQKILVHHTDTPNTTDYSRAQAFNLAHIMQNDQMDVRHWIDTGQHFTISRGSYVMEGRHGSLAALRGGTRQVESAHCVGQNTVAIGIENEGTYSSVEPRDSHYATLVDLCVYICGQYRIPAYQIYGHRDFLATECPGDRLYALLPKLRSDVAARVGGDPTPPKWPMVSSGANGETVRTLQYLLVQHGKSLTVDGAFGPATDTAVREFQKLVNAGVDGVAGNQTWNQLVGPVRRGDSGEAVKAAQSQLTAHGVPVDVDGAFGPGTQAAVTRFQSTRSLPADGVVDARTWSRLVG